MHKKIIFAALTAVTTGCAISPEQCDPLIPDIQIGTALVCWVNGNTEANLANMRTEVSDLAERIELQQLAVRQITISSDLMSTDIIEYEKYLLNTQRELDDLALIITESTTRNEKQTVAKEALTLELQDLQQKIAQAKESTQPTRVEIEQLQFDISKKRGAIEAMNQVLLE